MTTAPLLSRATRSFDYTNNDGATMLIIHEQSDDEIHDGWTYFASWRESRNYLLLLGALEKLNVAEKHWMAARGRSAPMRREWQVLRRCVMRGLARLHRPLLAARSPAQTEAALYSGGKRATLARIDQLNDRAIVMALLTSGAKRVDYDKALEQLAEWGIWRKKSYLQKRASQLGLSKRRRRSKTSREPSLTVKASLPSTPRSIQVAPGRTQHRGSRY